MTSVTRLGDLLDFGELFKAFGNNHFSSHDIWIQNPNPELEEDYNKEDVVREESSQRLTYQKNFLDNFLIKL